MIGCVSLGIQTVLRKVHGAILLTLTPGGSTVTYPVVYLTVETLTRESTHIYYKDST